MREASARTTSRTENAVITTTGEDKERSEIRKREDEEETLACKAERTVGTDVVGG